MMKVYENLSRAKKIHHMRRLQEKRDSGEISLQESTDLAYLESVIGELALSEMTDDELSAYYENEDTVHSKHKMRVHGKGTKRVDAVLSGRSIY